MIEAPRERPSVSVRPSSRLRAGVSWLLLGLLTGCGGGNDGTVVTRTGIVISGLVDDGTATSPVAGAACRLVDSSGNVLDRSTSRDDGSYLLLLEPDLEAFVLCTPPGRSALSLRTFVSTAGIAEGGELPDQDVLPATTMLARIVAAEAADDAGLDAAARLADLRARLVPLDSGEPPGDADLQLLADAATLGFDELRDAGDDVDFDAFLTDLFDDGDLDFFGTAAAAAAIEAAVAERTNAAGRSLAEAVLATHPAFEFTVANLGGARSRLEEIARFATVLEASRAAAGDRTFYTLGAGDMLAPGLSFLTSLETQDPLFDALAVDTLGLDAFTVGAEDLEYGPPVYGAFLSRLDGPAVVLLTDIDPTLESNALTPEALAVTSSLLLLDRGGRRMGLVSAAPEELPRLASTRLLGTFTGAARIERIQEAIDATLAAGARLVVLLTSERSLAAVETLLGALSGVDLVLTLPGVPAVDTSFAGEGPQPLALVSVDGGDGRSRCCRPSAPTPAWWPRSCAPIPSDAWTPAPRSPRSGASPVRTSPYRPCPTRRSSRRSPSPSPRPSRPSARPGSPRATWSSIRARKRSSPRTATGAPSSPTPCSPRPAARRRVISPGCRSPLSWMPARSPARRRSGPET